MQGLLRTILTTTVVAALAATVTTSAWGQERVAVLGFSGPSGGTARAVVRRVLSDEYEIVDLPEWNRAASEIGARGNAPRNLARVAEELGVKAIVSGGVRRARRRWSLGVVVRDGANGQVIGRAGRQIPAPTRAGALAGALARNVMSDIADAEGAAAAPPPEPPPVEEPVEPAEDYNPQQYDDIENELPPGMGGDEDDRQVEDEESIIGDDDFQIDDTEGAGSDSGSDDLSSSPWGWMEIGVEVNGSSRDFSVPINPSCDTANRSEAAFDSSIFPEFGARFSFYPGGIFTDTWPAHIGLEFSYHHHVYLRVVNRRRVQDVESEQYAFTAGLTYRIAVGNADRGINIWPRAGFGRYSFFLGDVGNDIVPPFVYDHIYLGLNSFIPFSTRYIGLELGGHYLAVFNIGEYAIEAYNASGELPSTNGFQFSAGLSGQIYAGLRWRLGFELLGFISNHVGKGRGWGMSPTSTECDGNCENFVGCVDTTTPDREPVTGGIYTTDSANDIIWRLVAHLSYRFGWNPDALGGGGRSDDDDERSDGWYDDESGGGEEEPADEWDDGEW